MYSAKSAMRSGSYGEQFLSLRVKARLSREEQGSQKSDVRSWEGSEKKLE